MSRTAWIERPPLTEAPDAQTWHRTAGTLAGTFAASTFGLGVTKTGIAIILIGIIVALWRRVNAVGAALPKLRTSTTNGDTRPLTGDLDTPYGPASASARSPAPLTIHRMAEVLWLPVLAMGAMALAAGLVLGLATSAEAAGTEAFRVASAWSQGTLFLGEGLLLSGISFLLGTILSSLRRGGAEVQESLGVSVQTLKMPATAKAFIALMAIGMMAIIGGVIGHFVVAAQTTTGADLVAAEQAFVILEAVRRIGVSLHLVAIAFGLATIVEVLRFQAVRIGELWTPPRSAPG